MTFKSWLLNKTSDAIERDLLKGATNWCRYRGRDARCRFPSSLDADASGHLGHLVWRIEDRGPCSRSAWDAQMFCPLAEAGPDIGGPPGPVAYEQGGQRTPPPPSKRLDLEGTSIAPALAVRVDGHLREVQDLAPARAVLDDGTMVSENTVHHPCYHPNAGLS